LRAVISQRLLYLKDRGFVFIPEVFIPNNMARNKIARGELKELSNAFHTNTMRENGCFTFKDTLSILQQQAIISADDQRAMLDGLVFFE
jgi:Tfp pilus assembly pilus retraction ATPase PilT